MRRRVLSHPSLAKSLPMAAAALTLTALSCGRPAADSAIKWAHLPAPSMTGTPMGHLAIIEQKIPHTFSDRLNVCVQKSGQNETDQHRLLETRLAHAMWLREAGYGRDEFETLSFTLEDSCSTSDASHMTVVIFGDLSKEKPGDQFAQLFEAASMSCKSEPDGISCRSDGGLHLGWGGPAVIGYSFLGSDPGKWVNTARRTPGSIKLSPHVDWMPLSFDLEMAPDVKSADRENLLARYAGLVRTAYSATFSDLTDFGKELAKVSAISAQDKEFRRTMELLAPQQKDVSNYVYRPKMAGFHTLLHEVGHTFGMSHADNPNADMVTGSSATTTCDSAGVCKTKESAMAYGKFFTYLTEDDQAGIKAAADAVRKDISSHK